MESNFIMSNIPVIMPAGANGRLFPLGAIIADAAPLDSLRERVAELQEASDAIVALGDSENRDLTDEEVEQIEGHAAEIDRVARQIAARERVEASRQGQGRRTVADSTANASPAANANPNKPARHTVPASAKREDRRHGFEHLGEFALAVRGMASGRTPDTRITNAAATTYSSESVGADGGVAVPPEFRSEIMSKVFGEDSLISRTDQTPISGNTLTMPIDMTTPWQTTGGIQSYWTGEAAARTQSKVALEDVTVKLSTLTTLVPVTQELLEDAPAMDSYLRRKAPEKMDFKLSNAIGWGTGVGMPLGFMSAPCLVTVAAEGAQTADTINATNVVKMNARMPVASRRTAVWLIHPDAEPQLPLMTIGQQPVYMPPGGLADSQFGRLLGRPVIPHQICKTVGDLGDIMFVDLGQYLALVKSGGMRSDVSVHLWFDQDIVAYKFTLRVGGQPWWSAATASLNGSLTQSPFVTLAAR